MATRSAVLTFALPEDVDADELQIYSASTEGGSRTLALTVSGYEYGTTTYEYDALDDTTWYQIAFRNNTDGEVGPASDWVYGGNFDQAAPFLAVSTGTDGANYATTQDVYDYSTLDTVDVSTARVSQALRRGRAVIDLRTADLDLDRFTKTFDTDTSRKKFNASLRVLKEAEINIALGNVYRGLADDIVMKGMRETLDETEVDLDSISIGDASLSGGGPAVTSRSMREITTLANRYLGIGAALLASLQPPSVRLHTSSGEVTSPRFKYPFNGAN